MAADCAGLPLKRAVPLLTVSELLQQPVVIISDESELSQMAGSSGLLLVQVASLSSSYPRPKQSAT